jgi:repressor LexA
MNLTARQTEILEFLVQQVEEQGMPPTRGDIAAHFRFSRAAADDQLRKLAERGYIELSNVARGIRLLEPALRLKPAKQFELPLIGKIAAGTPVLAEVNIETRIVIDRALFQPKADFLHLVSGDSMREAGILNGDLVGIHAQSQADNNQIVAAVIADSKTGEDTITLKRYVLRGRRVILKPENSHPRYKPIEIDLSQFDSASQDQLPFRIAGIFAGLFRAVL